MLTFSDMAAAVHWRAARTVSLDKQHKPNGIQNRTMHLMFDVQPTLHRFFKRPPSASRVRTLATNRESATSCHYFFQEATTFLIGMLKAR